VEIGPAVKTYTGFEAKPFMADSYNARTIQAGDIYGEATLYGRFEADKYTF
jgi:hypothetical protein